MLAAVLRAHGAAPVPEERADPSPGPGEVLLRVTAAPVVPLDLLCASGTSYFGPPALPYVPGVQAVGEVVAGDGPVPGTRVFVSTQAGMAAGDGTLAELCVVRVSDVVELPAATAGAGDAEVAALGLSAVAAWQALGWRARLQPGEDVVVLGAGGAVGQAAIGAARAMGAGRVVAVCRAGASAQRARDRSPDAVIELGDVDPSRLTEALRAELPDGAGVVLDPVFGWVAEAAAGALADGGRLVNLGGSAGDAATFSSAGLRGRSVSVLGYTNNALSAEQRATALRAVVDEAARGHLAVAHQVGSLAEVQAAWQAVADGTGLRQVVVP